MNSIYGSITFFYYDDLGEASRFYGETMGFEKVLDVGFAQLFKVYDNVHVGLVDGSRGSMRPAEQKSVMLSIFVDDVNEWYNMLKDKGLDLRPPEEPDYLLPPEVDKSADFGYTLELLQWLKKPYGQ